MSKPLISIAMATYNGEKYLEEQLNSIFMQTYDNIEVIVCDDCSTDSTVDILKKYGDKYTLKYSVNESNLGFKKNFEKAIALCAGEYIALADQDDVWVNNKLELLTQHIGDFSLIHSACCLIDENSQEISPLWLKKDNFKYPFEKFIFGNSVTGCTVLFKKELLINCSPIPTQEKYHDWWIALLASKKSGITYIKEPLVKYRQHNEQDTGADFQSLGRIFLRFLGESINKPNSKKYKKAQQNISRLNSYLNERNDVFDDYEKKVIQDAITYYEEYVNNFFHLKSFLISLKYSQFIYYKNKFFYKSILKDLLA